MARHSLWKGDGGAEESGNAWTSAAPLYCTLLIVVVKSPSAFPGPLSPLLSFDPTASPAKWAFLWVLLGCPGSSSKCCVYSRFSWSFLDRSLRVWPRGGTLDPVAITITPHPRFKKVNGNGVVNHYPLPSQLQQMNEDVTHICPENSCRDRNNKLTAAKAPT